MTPQKPAQGIMQTGDYVGAKSFQVACDCGSDDHAAKMWIEVQSDKDFPSVEVSFYVTTWTPIWGSWRERLRALYEILFTGVHKQEHHLILDKQSAINFADAIKTTVKELEK